MEKSFYKSKNFIIWVMIGSFLYSTLMLIGATVYDFLPVDLRIFTYEQILINLKFWAVNFSFFIVMLLLMCLIQLFLANMDNTKASIKNKRNIWWLAPIIFFCYLVVFLAYFPGIVGYDSYMQIPQALGKEALTNHHPVLHTMILSLCLKIGNLFQYKGAGIVIYSVLSMLFSSLGITYALFLMESKLKNWIVVILSGLWFALYPTFALLSFSVTKDMFFSITFLLFAERLYLNLTVPDTKIAHYMEVIVWGLLSMLLRNNAMYAIMVVIVVCLAVKKIKRINIVYVMISVVVFLGITRFVYPSLGIGNSPVQEAMSIPIQQISAVYTIYYSELDEDTRDLIEEYIPDISWFNPSTVDYVKITFNGSKYSEDKASFWKTWASLGLEYPAMYLNYGILLNLESWLPQYEFKDVYYYTKYIATDGPSEYLGVDRTPVLPGVITFYEKYSNYEHPWMNRGILKMLFSCSLPFVFLYVSITYMFATKKYQQMLFYVPFIFYWLTHLLGPLTNIRYFLCILIMMPIGMLIINKD